MVNFTFYRKKSFGIDLGNNNTLVSDEHKILMDQPSYIAFHAEGNSVKAVGDQAYGMFEKTHDELRSIKPLRCGVIADFDSANTMLSEMLHRVFKKDSLFSGYENIISGVPYATTDVERRALRAALDQFRARRTYLFYEPLAAALGMGLNIQEPNGKMIVDIGGGITEIVVISLSGIAAFQSVKVAGDNFDSEIQDYFRRNFNMAIGLKTAEQIKIGVGAVLEHLENVSQAMLVKGKNLVEGIPMTKEITSIEVAHIIEKSMSAIENAIIQTLEICSPELASDIFENGIYITGGGALLRGLKERLQLKIKVPVHIDQYALTAVSRGVGKALSDPKKFRNVLME